MTLFRRKGEPRQARLPSPWPRLVMAACLYGVCYAIFHVWEQAPPGRYTAGVAAGIMTLLVCIVVWCWDSFDIWKAEPLLPEHDRRNTP